LRRQASSYRGVVVDGVRVGATTEHALGRVALLRQRVVVVGRRVLAGNRLVRARPLLGVVLKPDRGGGACGGARGVPRLVLGRGARGQRGGSGHSAPSRGKVAGRTRLVVGRQGVSAVVDGRVRAERVVGHGLPPPEEVLRLRVAARGGRGARDQGGNK